MKNGAIDVIDAFKEVVGEEGTLVFPTFTISNSMYETLTDKEQFFDVNLSKSTVGAITNCFLQQDNTYRSVHPTHSVAAWGKHASFIVKDHFVAETNFGKGTPFGKMMELNGKIVGLGISYGPVTYYHVYEDLNLNLFPNVYFPDRIKVKCRDSKGLIQESDFLCHNPEFHKKRIDKDAEIESFFSDYFEKKNISKKTKIGQGSVWWMNAENLITELTSLHKKNITIYSVKNGQK